MEGSGYETREALTLTRLPEDAGRAELPEDAGPAQLPE